MYRGRKKLHNAVHYIVFSADRLILKGRIAIKRLGDLNDILDSLSEGNTVRHKKFGKGVVVKINGNEKFIHVKFALGEKKFIFPDAFLMGFLEL